EQDVPQVMSCAGVQRDEIALAIARKHESTGGRQHAGPGAGKMLELPAGRSRCGIDGAHGALVFFLGQWKERTANERPPRTMRRLEVFVGHERVALFFAE